MSQSYRVAHITFDMDFGGAERVIQQILTASQTDRFQHNIICIDSPLGPMGRQLQAAGYPVLSLDRKPGFDLTLIKNMRREIVRQKIDVLHCHQYSPYIYGLFAAFSTHAKVVFTEHGRFYPDKRRLKRYLINPVLNQFTAAVTAICDATAQALVAYENFPQNKIQVIYNGIARNCKHSGAIRLECLHLPQEALVLGTVARLDPIKNHALMIRASAQLKDKYPNLYLLIVGDGPERANLEKLIAHYRLEDRVIITGWFENPSLFYSLMDIFLLTSFSEGTAMTLLEAMAAGLPCIATDVGGNPEIVESERTGFVIPNDDLNALIEKIEQLLGDPQLRKQMGQNGKIRFEGRFTADRMVQAYLALYAIVSK